MGWKESGYWDLLNERKKKSGRDLLNEKRVEIRIG